MKTGFFGGTFSPPHSGHVRAAKLFVAEMKLDRLIVMPDALPPHKETDPWGTAAARLAMTHLAFDDLAEVSDYEINKGGRSYTVDTLSYLSERYPEDELFMLVGEDMFLSFESWREPERIFSLASVVSLERENGRREKMLAAAEKYKDKYGARCVLLPDEALEISSSGLREACLAGESLSQYVPEKVEQYIKEKGLYRY